MTTQAKRLVPFLLLFGCSVLITVVVWTLTLHLTPTFMTFWTCMMWTALQLRYAPEQVPGVHRILFRFGLTGMVMLGVWWAINHVQPIR